MARVSLQNLTKTYAGGYLRAVDGLNVDIADGEFLVLVGPSGCGKSTALRMIAGLEDITDGAVWIGDQFVNDVHPKDRDIAMVFQNYALYPHMSVFDNIAFALQISQMPRSEIDARVREAARILELTDYLKRRPGHLSGGQRQRVAMGRAIVRNPSVFLMDEPLSNLDAKLRVQMRAEIHSLQHRLGVTTIYVTHDQTEAMTMGDRVALLKDGVLQQVDRPTDIYNRPANTFVAAFIGSPTMNLYHAAIDGGPTLKLGSSDIRIPQSVFDARPGLSRYKGKPLIAGIRPEDIGDAATAPQRDPSRELTAKVELFEDLGSDTLVHLGVDAQAAEVRSSDSLDEIKSNDAKGRCIARFTAKSEVAIDQTVTVQLDTERLHFFDAETGEAIWT
ncbi:sn-glycerol-3-phosphate ABC transporter ATP-binding protein UgpC [Rhodobacteraceae bacterium 2CG4]|uniref:sn-glycerol-3-phosphate ABC transporter ATP-binding protein UgpC n=1 Tax=Halovulum marinum TaxID=2662447 RepID=A0A6L5YYH5_9RHOB|nr:sn-glycerol-3-phosphate ABC transporter ATP-binding protein UgpC [Halovulum marinum]MSU89346.1 sn-glycerol-3-phosphate ABC transporter ATP-binding protein UgpC [Halovulum marinum]